MPREKNKYCNESNNLSFSNILFGSASAGLGALVHQVVFLPNALDDLSKLDKSIVKRIMNRIEWFSENIENSSPTPLKSRLSGFYKLRIGDW